MSERRELPQFCSDGFDMDLLKIFPGVSNSGAATESLTISTEITDVCWGWRPVLDRAERARRKSTNLTPRSLTV